MVQTAGTVEAESVPEGRAKVAAERAQEATLKIAADRRIESEWSPDIDTQLAAHQSRKMRE